MFHLQGIILSETFCGKNAEGVRQQKTCKFFNALSHSPELNNNATVSQTQSKEDSHKTPKIFTGHQ
jgi:hypothetical protein